MARKDWLALVAVHSDSWLYAVAFYYGAKLDQNSRYGEPAHEPWLIWSSLHILSMELD